MDASEYIKELKQKVARLNQEIAREEETHTHKENSFPMVHTDTCTYHTVLCFTDRYPVPRLYSLTLSMIDGSVLYLHIVA
jgi:hypothetical protein